MNPYERWDDWEWERAAQEVGRDYPSRSFWRSSRDSGDMKKGWGGILNYWTGGQKKTLLAALFFLTLFFSSHGTDFLSQGIYTAYQKAMDNGNYYASLTAMAKDTIGLGGLREQAMPVDAKMQGKFYPPISGPVVAGFGQVSNDEKGTVHNGIDVGSSLGTPVVSPYYGAVLSVGVDPQIGKFVKIDCGDGWSTILGNLGDVSVTKGQKVNQGEIIGTVGLSAPLKQPWLHFELRKNDKPLNPLPYLAPASAK